MTTQHRPERHDAAPCGPHAHGKRHETTARTELSVDERSALCLLTMARDLLAPDHKSLASMIEYVILDLTDQTVRGEKSSLPSQRRRCDDE